MVAYPLVKSFAKFNPGVYANWELIVVDSIAKTLNLAAADVAAAIKAFKL